jgi:hypothetical protein
MQRMNRLGPALLSLQSPGGAGGGAGEQPPPLQQLPPSQPGAAPAQPGAGGAEAGGEKKSLNAVKALDQRVNSIKNNLTRSIDIKYTLIKQVIQDANKVSSKSLIQLGEIAKEADRLIEYLNRKNTFIPVEWSEFKVGLTRSTPKTIEEGLKAVNTAFEKLLLKLTRKSLVEKLKSQKKAVGTNMSGMGVNAEVGLGEEEKSSKNNSAANNSEMDVTVTNQTTGTAKTYKIQFGKAGTAVAAGGGGGPTKGGRRTRKTKGNKRSKKTRKQKGGMK